MQRQNTQFFLLNDYNFEAMNKTKMRNSQFGVWIDFRFSKDNLLATENSVSVQCGYYYELRACHKSFIVCT